MSQSLPFPAHPGASVAVRGRRFRVETTRAWPDCVELRLSPPGGGEVVRLLWPFDRPRGVVRDRPRFVSRNRAATIAARTLASTARCDSLRGAGDATVDLRPFQLEPALAVVAGRARRLLLADAVGLGKTIQAGLVLAELECRGALERALVVTPPGLRDQWIEELGSRFGLEAVIVDLAWLRRARCEVGPGGNPWLVPHVAVASYDFVKRPEILRALEPILWDAVVLDEAHAAAPATDRAAALTRVARRARHVLLLTATPHAGDDAAFAALCAMGAAAGAAPVACFRRTRRDVGLRADRHTHLLRIRPTPAERRLHAALGRYAARVWTEAAGGPGARLAAEVLMRRACSSPRSLLRSLERRTALLRGGAPAEALQLQLPLDDGDHDPADDEPLGALGVQGLADTGREIAWLASLADLARTASASCAKHARLRRLLGRRREPAIVFTEYRDTLAELVPMLAGAGPVACLHGGLAPAERREAIAWFTSGAATILVATDAAGEGLNLHHRCRLVVNLELPWSPRRLEQRAGRVDRIGQSRRVHVVHLLTRGTADERVLAVLARRTGAARLAFEDGDEVDDRALAEALTTGRALRATPPPTPPTPIDMRAAAVVETARLSAAREAARATPAGAPPLRVPVRAEVHDGVSSLVVLATVTWIDGNALEIERMPLGFTVTLGRVAPRRAGGWRRLVRQLGPALEAAAAPWMAERRAAVEAWLHANVTAAVAREREIAAAIEADSGRLFVPHQRGLFDHRGERRVCADREAIEQLRATCRDRLGRCSRAMTGVEARVDVALVVETRHGDRR